MAEAKQLAEKVDKQTKVIEEAVEKRAAFKEELVTVILKIKSLPQETVPATRRSTSQSSCGESGSGEESHCKHGGARVTGRIPVPPSRDNRGENAPAQVTGQRDSTREVSPGRRSPPAPEQGLVANLREPALPSLEETPDEEMGDVSGEPPSQEDSPGEELGDDALAVEEARKRVHAALDAGEHPLLNQQDTDGHDVLERLHLRPAAEASREYPEEKFGSTGTPQGAIN
eukprot:6471508-Amphidinium_carterae.1